MLNYAMDAMWGPWLPVFSGLVLILVRRQRPALALLVLGIILGLWMEQLDARSLATAAVLLLSAWLVHGSSSVRRNTGWLLFLLTVVALRAHVLPGFNNPLVLNEQLSAQAPVYRMFLNWDKLLIIVWLVYVWRRIDWSTNPRVVLREGLGWGMGSVGLCVLIGWILGVVYWDPKLPQATWVWLLNNLVLVCMGEELLFRGFIQLGLARAWNGRRGGDNGALAVAALLFGLAHLPAGTGYAAISVLAGLGYGLAHRRGGLQAAVLAHATLNAVHFFLFTYPNVA
jgi:membrane protease YdiL (CAAX protease family)